MHTQAQNKALKLGTSDLILSESEEILILSLQFLFPSASKKMVPEEDILINVKAFQNSNTTGLLESGTIKQLLQQLCNKKLEVYMFATTLMREAQKLWQINFQLI